MHFKEDHKNHLRILMSQSVQLLQDFCRISLEYLRKGHNQKIYQSASNKLECSPEVIRSAIEGLAYLFLECCKRDIDDAEFRDSMLTCGFTEEQHEVLNVFYKTHRDEIRGSLMHLGLQLPKYRDLDWRFEVQVASRSLLHQITPLVTMRLSLENTAGVVENVVLQTDPTNLRHMTEVLEEALQEATCQHTRKIQRSLV